MRILNRISNIFKTNFRTIGNNPEKIDYYVLQQMIKNNEAMMIDVRSIQEFKEGHLLGATNIPLGEIKHKINSIIPNHGQAIIVYCQMGGRSEKAAKILKKMGYTNVYQLNGGLDAI